MDSPETNKELYDEVSAAYTRLELRPAERALLAKLRGRLGELEMLDLGIGTGRTSYTFSVLVKRYVGLDYSGEMVAKARALIGEDEHVELVEGDARDLTTVGGPFDFVLFSFNGIDAVDHEDRLEILRQVRGVLRPEGTFAFSSHSLGALPLSRRISRDPGAPDSAVRQLYSLVQNARYARGITRSNREVDLDQARRQGWTQIRDGAHDFELRNYYVDPAEQLRQLEATGFELIVAWDAAGREIDPLLPRRDPWITYWAKPS